MGFPYNKGYPLTEIELQVLIRDDQLKWGSDMRDKQILEFFIKKCLNLNLKILLCFCCFQIKCLGHRLLVYVLLLHEY